MSTPPSPTISVSGSATISADAIAAAAERRTREANPQLTAAQLAVEHERRQKFRRLVDPGITRPNAKDQAMSSLKVYESLFAPHYLLLNVSRGISYRRY